MVALRSPATKPLQADQSLANTDPSSFRLTETDWIIIFDTKPPASSKKTQAVKAHRGADPVPNPAPEETEDANASAMQAWEDVVSRLLSVHLAFRIQDWGRGKLAIYVRCPDRVLKREVYRSRVTDWLNDSGISELEPPVVLTDLDNPSPLSPAERSRFVHELLTTPTYEGGAGITMDEDVVGVTDAVGGKYVEAIFAPHDKEFSDKWVKNWAKKWLLTDGDLDAIRDYAGEKVAYYFGFLRFYLASLIFPAVVGMVTHYVDGDFSYYYGLFLVGWSTVFIALWNRRAQQLASRWGTRNYSKIEKVRPEFRPTKFVVDQVTHERQPYYPYWRRWIVQSCITLPTTLVTIASMMAVVFVLVSVQAATKVYDGPGKDFVGYIPTIVYSASIPTMGSYYARLAARLVELENFSTDTQHAESYAQKLFTFTSLVAFMALFAESYIFIPFSTQIGHALKSRGFTTSETMDLGPESLSTRMAYLMVTAQVINAFTEVVVPLLTTKYGTVRKGLERSEKEKQKESEEDGWVRRAKKEFERPSYDVAGDYSEMAIQFGYVMLFSTGYSLAPLLCLINNFFELRTDAFKICHATRRPTPIRADNIGPWLRNLRLLSYVGSSITIPSLVVLYRGWQPTSNPGQAVLDRLPWCLAAVLVAEHLYLLVKWAVDEAVRSVPTGGGDRRRRAAFDLKRTYLAKAGIDVMAGGHGGKVKWNAEAKGVEQGHEAVQYGVALKAIQDVLK
ncbi:hypothetical protein HKX48_003960 [Thoreauomyces humboldtii]|nr:hypothetical protein HKX48_003960 [Thoreauomyces humboldtii]